VKQIATDILNLAKGDIKEAETSLKAARDLIDRLKKAGENTSELESNYAKAQARLRRFKAAFEV
jgi:uncharacterized protein involved in exopolysaccharide biosynthesis